MVPFTRILPVAGQASFAVEDVLRGQPPAYTGKEAAHFTLFSKNHYLTGSNSGL